MNSLGNNHITSSEADHNIANKLHYTWQAFFERFKNLTQVQRLAVPKILDGKHLLICSPTASGKTEAVCAPLVERNFKTKNWLILYISPTRALVNDLYERLRQPLNILGMDVSRHTGDHHDNKKNTRILLTTPESFDSILCNGKIKQGGEVVDHRLSNVKALVIDEIHCTLGTPRGEHLIWLIERLKRLRKYAKEQKWSEDDDLQIIAISATISSPESVRQKYLPQNNSECLIIRGGREIEPVSIECELPTTEMALRQYILQLEGKSEKILVFSNSRKRVDLLAQELKEFLTKHNYKTFAHHGSLSKNLREDAEESMKTEQRVVLFSSATLEVGIDIGDIDLVVLDGPTADIQTLLQRIGRGNRRTDTTRVLCCSGSLAESIIHSAMIEAAREGLIFGNVSGPCYAVARQQIASYIYQSKNTKRGRKHLIRFLESQLTVEHAEGLIQHMLEKNEIKTYEEDYLGLANFWLEQKQGAKIHSNIENNFGIVITDINTGTDIAHGVRYASGKIINIGGKLLKIEKWDGRKLHVKQIKNTQTDANWGYCCKSWLKGTGQQEAIRYYCNIPENLFPEIILGNYKYIFHFGGRTRKIVLKLIFETYYKSNNIEVNDWYFKTLTDLRIDWKKKDINIALLKINAKNNLENLESALGRPYANKELPINLRLDEIYQWLKLEQEVEIIKNSNIKKIKNDAIKEVLKLIVKEYEV